MQTTLRECSEYVLQKTGFSIQLRTITLMEKGALFPQWNTFCAIAESQYVQCKRRFFFMLFNNRFKKLAIPLFSASIVLIPTVGMAQDSDIFLRQLARQLYQIALRAAGQDYSLVTVEHGTLHPEQTESLTVSITSGYSYAIVGVCDNDCNDIDLHLYDGNNNLIDFDIDNDDTPVIVVSPRQSGEYRLRVAMVRCSDSPCYYGVGLFNR